MYWYGLWRKGYEVYGILKENSDLLMKVVIDFKLVI